MRRLVPSCLVQTGVTTLFLSATSLAVALLTAGVGVGPADAGGPPQSVPAISEYVETFPSAEGSVSSPSGGAPSTGNSLSEQLQKRIQNRGGPEAAALESLIASSPRRASNVGMTDEMKVPTATGLVAALVTKGGLALILLVVGAFTTGAAAASIVGLRRMRAARD